MAMKTRDQWITLAFLLFIFLIPAVTLVRGLTPSEGTLSEEQQAVLEGNGTLSGETTDTQQTTETTQSVDEPWFTALQTRLNSFTESLFGRSRLISFNTELTQRLTGGTYMESTQVLLGKNNWLFYKTELDGHPLWDYMGINHFTDEELTAMAENLTTTRDGLAELGIEMYVSVLPNKEIVYAEYMPDTVARVDEVSRAQQFAEYMWANTDVPLSYPKDALIAAKSEAQVYYQTDTHWNQIGAFVGVQDLLSVAYGDTPASISSVTFTATMDNYAGDLSVIAGVSDKYAIDTTYVFDAASADASQYHDEVALIVGDSFGGFLSTVAKGYYREVIWLNRVTDQFTMSMLDEYDVDVVIWEAVERNMDIFLTEKLLEQ